MQSTPCLRRSPGRPSRSGRRSRSRCSRSQPAAGRRRRPPTPSASTTTSTPTPTTTSKSALPSGVPERLRHAYGVYVKLLKAPKDSSLPPSLAGSITKAAALSPGSQKHDAAGAVLTTNGGALVGVLVFPNHAAALADLKAFPPDAGPNKIIGTPKGFPKPAYILSAAGNGYTARYVVFVEGGVLVNAWAYGKKGKQSEAQCTETRRAERALGPRPGRRGPGLDQGVTTPRGRPRGPAVGPRAGSSARWRRRRRRPGARR